MPRLSCVLPAETATPALAPRVLAPLTFAVALALAFAVPLASAPWAFAPLFAALSRLLASRWGAAGLLPKALVPL